MDYEKFFEQKLADLHDEGRYRVFADLERQRGGTQATFREGGQRNDVTVWCSNDYLGMGQSQIVKGKTSQTKRVKAVVVW